MLFRPTKDQLDAMSFDERQKHERAEAMELYMNSRPKPRPLPPQPGKSLSERERHIANAKARQDAEAAQRARSAAQAAQTRKAEMDQSTAMAHSKAQFDTELGNAKGALRLAVERLDLDAAKELAQQVIVMERVQTELQRFSDRRDKQLRGPGYYAGRMERV